MHVLILGLGVSGQAALEFCKKRGDTVSVFDDTLAPEPFSLEEIDLVVKSPGISLDHPLVTTAQKGRTPIVGEIELALKELKGKTVYAVTGSNGKTTTTLLATHLLQAEGKKALAVGNVGTPLIAQIDADVDYFVVELSSFQLETLHHFPIFDGAVVLNITPNHLDRHASFDAYAQAKLNVRKSLKKGAPFYMSQAVADQFKVQGTVFDVEAIPFLSYRGGGFYPHEMENVAAALALTGASLDGIASFEKPPHRIEFVREVGGVTFVNDSKATSVDAVAKAVEAIPSKVILIAGGIDKGGAYADWVPLFKEKVSRVIAIGEAAARLEEELCPEVEVERAQSIEEAIKKATLYAKSGETVLLSPGCSSYDQFKSYEHRGNRFKELVCAL